MPNARASLAIAASPGSRCPFSRLDICLTVIPDRSERSSCVHDLVFLFFRIVAPNSTCIFVRTGLRMPFAWETQHVVYDLLGVWN